MKTGKMIFGLRAAAAAILVFAASAYASTDPSKKITFTTKSKEAKEYVAQIVKQIESFQGGPQTLPLAQKAVEADPNFAFAHYLVSVFAGPPPAGQPHLAKANELAKTASEGERRYIEAITLLRSQKPDEAAQIFTELAKQYPEERMVQMMLGQIYSNRGKLPEAKAAFERALQLDSSTPRVYAFLGNIHLVRGEYGKARELFNTSLSKKAPATAAFLPSYGLAYSYLYEGDYDSAIKVLNGFYDAYMKAGDQNNFPPVFIWNSIGRVLLESGRAEEALKAYEKGYESIPGSSLAEQEKKTWYGRLHHGRGRALAKLGKHEEAWKEAEMIKKMIDEAGEAGKQFMPAYHYIAGYLKLESKDYAAAVEHLKQSDLTDPFHKLLLARAYERSGDEANAQKLYKEIVDSPQVNLERALAYPEAKKKLKS